MWVQRVAMETGQMTATNHRTGGVTSQASGMSAADTATIQPTLETQVCVHAYAYACQ